MTPQQIEAMKLALEALKKGHYYMIDAGLPNQSLLNEAFTAYKALEKALEEHAMREVQRLGQEIEQEPVPPPWWPAVENILTEYGLQAIDFVADFKNALAQPEFIKHEVENADDWSEWVCPDPKNYLMKCCDCGLVHEAEFGVVRYKSETEREDCDIVDDPNLQAVFRMRRSEEWTPEDTAHRSGGLPMAQPEQKPMAIVTSETKNKEVTMSWWHEPPLPVGTKLYTTPPQRKPLSASEIVTMYAERPTSDNDMIEFARAIEAAHGIKENT